MKFTDYNARKAQAISLLTETKEAVSNEKIVNDINKKIDKIKNGKFVVSVFGEFSNGKSSFLNALMGFGEEVLKEDDTASTATITKILQPEDGEEKNKAKIIYNNGTTEMIDINNLKEYVARNTGIDVEGQISEVDLYVESEYLKNGVEIVDTPGLNSTYKLHTDIAIRQIEKSDAAIFLFDFEHAGRGTELDLLKRIKRYMDRVFFVLNKADIAEKSAVVDGGGSAEEIINKTIKNTIDKMVKVGIEDAANKKIYPISALRAKEAIRKNDASLLKKSGLPDFTQVLENYLAGEENIKDRLDSPLKSVQQLISVESDRIDNIIEACNNDKESLKKEINEKKAEIEETKKSLRSKKRNITNSVASEVRRAKGSVDDIEKEAMAGVENMLQTVNSSFSIRLRDFGDITFSAFADFKNGWEKLADKLEEKLLNTVSESIDYDNDYNAIEGRIRSVIRSGLMLENIDVEKPVFQFERLKEIDDKVEKIRKDRENLNKKLMSAYTKKEERENLIEEISRMNKELERYRDKKEREIERYSDIRIYRGEAMETRRESRGGFFGTIFDVLAGKKKVQERITYTDDTEYREAQAQISKIEEELSRRIKSNNDDIRAIKSKIAEYPGLDSMIESICSEINIMDNIYTQGLVNQQKDSIEMEKQIIQIGKEKYINSLRVQLNSRANQIKTHLDNSKNSFISIINSVLESDSQKITEDELALSKIVSLNSKTPEEIEQELLSLYAEKNSLTKAVEKIGKERSINND